MCLAMPVTLTRNDLLAYRDSLRKPRAAVTADGRQRAMAPGERTQARTGFSPRRFLPPVALAACASTR
jgi:hypothetical protein